MTTKRIQGPPWYYQRVSVQEQNNRLRERLRRKQWELDYSEAEKHELEDEVEVLRRENGQLHDENHELRERIAYLQNLLRPRKARSNHGKKPVGSEPAKPQRKIGAKPGHPPHIRQIPGPVDVHLRLVPDHCPQCHGQLLKPSLWHSHTQVDLPELPKTVVTQYHVGWCYCSHCKHSVSVADKFSRSKYGPRLHALVGYWKFGLGLTLPKIQECIRDLYNLEVGSSELSQMLSQDAAKLSVCHENLKTALRKEPYVCADETGWSKSGKTAWLWSFSSPRISYYTIEKGRSRDVVIDTLGEHFGGILSSDFLGSYTQIDSRKQKCWVHLLREVRQLGEKYPSNEEVPVFAEAIRRFYKRGVQLAKKNKQHHRMARAYQRLLSDTDRFIQRPWQNPELVTLSNRLRLHRDELYTFIKAGIPPHNNAAEREIRPAVLMRKTSYCNRSDRGAQSQAICDDPDPDQSKTRQTLPRNRR